MVLVCNKKKIFHFTNAQILYAILIVDLFFVLITFIAERKCLRGFLIAIMECVTTVFF